MKGTPVGGVIISLCLLILHLRRLPLLPRRRADCSPNSLQAPKVKPGAKEHNKDVEDAVSPKDTIIHPLVTVEDVEPSCKFVTSGILTEFTKTVAAILYITAGLCDEGGGIRLACLTGWRCESSKFRGGTDDGSAMGGS